MRGEILDVVLIANEMVDEKRHTREKGVVLKIDFEKPYDRVDWSFLHHALEMKGFSFRWRSWMEGCLSSTNFAMLMNGSAKECFKASKGLRQGNPLSPFLFTIATNILNRLLLRAKESNVLEGFLVVRIGVEYLICNLLMTLSFFLESI